MTAETPPFSPLVADLITAQMRQTHDTTNRLVDSLTAQLAGAQAELAAVRNGVLALIQGPWMPTSDAIRLALYPSDGTVERFRDAGAVLGGALGWERPADDDTEPIPPGCEGRAVHGRDWPGGES